MRQINTRPSNQRGWLYSEGLHVRLQVHHCSKLVGGVPVVVRNVGYPGAKTCGRPDWLDCDVRWITQVVLEDVERGRGPNSSLMVGVREQVAVAEPGCGHTRSLWRMAGPNGSVGTSLFPAAAALIGSAIGAAIDDWRDQGDEDGPAGVPVPV
jgi:hypothetical protein